MTDMIATRMRRALQQLAREEMLVVTNSPHAPRGRGKKARPLVLGPAIVAADSDPVVALLELVKQCRNRDGNTIYGFSMVPYGSGWVLMGTPAISQVSFSEIG
jgi:hypothetical protein